jgi:hypothetical protein
LQIRASSADIILDWPACYADWVLEKRVGLATNNNWVPVTNTPAIVGSQLTVTNAAAEANCFYRLRQQ